MATIPYMPLYVADYLADTAHLTTIEHGAYLMLIMSYWQKGSAFTASDEQTLNGRLANVARMSSAEWDKVRPVLAEFFQITTDGAATWRHKRIDAELDKFRDKSNKAKAAGLASAERRFSIRSTDVQQTFNHTDADVEVDVNLKKASPKKREASPKGSRLTETQLPHEWGLWAGSEFGWPDRRSQNVFASFRDYWVALPGAKGVKLDWLATWRGWCRRENERNPERQQQAPPPRYEDPFRGIPKFRAGGGDGQGN